MEASNRSYVRRAVTIAVLIVVLLAAVPAESTGAASVSYSWRWSGGFTCTYSNGYTRSSYWF